MSYGVIEYNSDGFLKCELCGNFFNRLSNHLRYTHRMTSGDYKATFGLNNKQGLWSKSDLSKQREYTLSNFDKCVTINLINNPSRAPFKKGHIGRPKSMMREQAVIGLRKNLLCVDKKLTRDICRNLGKSGLGNKKRRELRDLRLHHNGRAIKFDEELSNALPALIGWCKMKYGAQYDEEITSNVVVRALEWGKFDFSRGKMITWLIGMAILMYKQKYQKEKKRYYQKISIEDVADELSATQPTLEISNMGEDRVFECMKRLTPREKSVIDLLIEGKKVRHIAEILGVTKGSMKSYLCKIRFKLRNEMNEKYPTMLDNSLDV